MYDETFGMLASYQVIELLSCLGTTHNFIHVKYIYALHINTLHHALLRGIYHLVQVHQIRVQCATYRQ